MAEVDDLAARLSRVMDDRAGDIEKEAAYYSGDRPVLVLPDRTVPAYEAIVNQARSPWASLVIDQAAERLEVTGFRVVTPGEDDSDVEADAACWDVWQHSQGDLYGPTAFATMLLHGAAYALVEQGGELPLISFEHPSMMATLTAPGGRSTVAAMKRWKDDDGGEVAVIWTADGAGVVARRNGDVWRPTDDQPVANTTGTVPVFAMKNKPDLLGGYSSDLDGLYPTLDRCCQSIADRITTQIYASTKVRYLIGVEPEVDEDGLPTERTLRLATDKLLLIENPDAKAGVFDASDLRQFIEVARSDIAALAAISRLPTYLLSGDLVNVSREALESLSQGLVSRVELRQAWAAPALSQAMRLALRLMGDERVTDPRTRVEPIWAEVIPPSVEKTASAAATLVGAGVLSPTGAQDMVLGLTPTERQKASQYARKDALDAQGAQVISGLFAQPAEQGQVTTGAQQG